MALPQIQCKECDYLNEGERIYCHNCGVKLDRSNVVAEVAKKEEDPKRQQQRVKKLLNPNAGGPRFSLGALVWSTLRAVVLGALVAAIIVMVQAPEGVPEETELAETRPLPELLKLTATAPPHLQLVIPVDEVNGFLRNTVRVQKEGGKVLGLMEFRRVFAGFDEEGVTITHHRMLYKLPIYVSMKFRLSLENGELVATPLASRIGRLKLPGFASLYAERVLKSVWELLEEERELISKVGGIRTEKGQIVFTPRPRAAGTPPGAPQGAAPAAAQPTATPAPGVKPLIPERAPLGHPPGSKPVGFGSTPEPET